MGQSEIEKISMNLMSNKGFDDMLSGFDKVFEGLGMANDGLLSMSGLDTDIMDHMMGMTIDSFEFESPKCVAAAKAAKFRKSAQVVKEWDEKFEDQSSQEFLDLEEEICEPYFAAIELDSCDLVSVTQITSRRRRRRRNTGTLDTEVDLQVSGDETATEESLAALVEEGIAENADIFTDAGQTVDEKTADIQGTIDVLIDDSTDDTGDDDSDSGAS